MSEIVEKGNMYSESNDYTRIKEWIQKEADQRRIKVRRISNHERGEWYHLVQFFDGEGKFIEDSCGFVTDEDVYRGSWDKKFVEWSEKIDENHTKIHMMISDFLPQKIPIFHEAKLGFIDDDHFHGFEIVMNNEDLTDEFQENQ